MFKGLSHTYKALLLAVVAYIAFSISDAAVKFLTPHYSVYQIIACDLGIAALLFLLFSSKLGGIRRLHDPQNMKLHVIRGAMNFIGSILVVYFFSIMPLTSVYTVMFLSPFMMAILAIPLHGEQVDSHRWISMFVGFGGVLMAFRPWENDISLTTFLMLLALPLCFSIMHIVMRMMKNPCDLTTGFYPMALACGPMFILAFTLGDFVAFEFLHLIALFISAVFILTGFITVSRAYHMADASLVAPVQYMQLIWGGLLGYLLFNDVPDFWMIAGSIIVVVSGIYLFRCERPSSGGVLPNIQDAS